jgi:hypothetical protein
MTIILCWTHGMGWLSMGLHTSSVLSLFRNKMRFSTAGVHRSDCCLCTRLYKQWTPSIHGPRRPGRGVWTSSSSARTAPRRPVRTRACTDVGRAGLALASTVREEPQLGSARGEQGASTAPNAAALRRARGWTVFEITTTPDSAIEWELYGQDQSRVAPLITPMGRLGFKYGTN